MDDSNRNYSNKSMEKSAVVDVSSKVMLASIIILFLIILLVVLLNFYAKWYWSRRIGSQTTGTRRRRRFVFTPSLEQNITIRQGLAASVFKALPVVNFSADEFKDGLECSVCLCEVEEGEKARVLPKCSHGFHVDCIDMWFQSHSTCPLCRNHVSAESSSPDSVPITLELIEAPSYPTNVRDHSGPEQEEEGETSPLSSSSSPGLRPDRELIIDIPQRVSHGFSVSPTNTPSSARRVVSEEDDDMKSPVSTRFKSLCKLLSREKRIVPNSPSTDIEQGGEVEGSSSKMSPAGYVI